MEVPGKYVECSQERAGDWGRSLGKIEVISTEICSPQKDRGPLNRTLKL